MSMLQTKGGHGPKVLILVWAWLFHLKFGLGWAEPAKCEPKIYGSQFGIWAVIQKNYCANLLKKVSSKISLQNKCCQNLS